MEALGQLGKYNPKIKSNRPFLLKQLLLIKYMYYKWKMKTLKTA